MRAALNKLRRDTLQTSIIGQFKAHKPNIDQYINRLRFPVVPRIVVYTNVQGAENYLQRIFPLYKYLTPSPQGQSDQILARTVAEQLTLPLESSYGGYLIKGFPFNINQALLLDRYLNGVNLAIHLRGQNQENSDESINNLLNYYDKTGTLVRLQYQSNPSAEHLQWVSRQIVSNIKSSQ